MCSVHRISDLKGQKYLELKLRMSVVILHEAKNFRKLKGIIGSKFPPQYKYVNMTFIFKFMHAIHENKTISSSYCLVLYNYLQLFANVANAKLWTMIGFTTSIFNSLNNGKL